ncbi:sulfur carrier protein ThiS [Colwelliaceae bacterium 6441]
MNIFINGQNIIVEGAAPSMFCALQQYLTTEQQKQSFAVALNGDFVGKTDYQQTMVNQGDSIDVLFPIQGG